MHSTGSSSWSARGLLDFNMAFARYPSALPPSAGSFPPDPPGAAFTQLREGDAWLDEEHNLLLAVERLVPCQEAALPVHRYSVYNFYGFRGENPGQEAVRRADYTGYAGGLRCLQLRVVTGVSTAPGTLDVKLRLQGLDDRNRLPLGGQQVGDAAARTAIVIAVPCWRLSLPAAQLLAYNEQHEHVSAPMQFVCVNTFSCAPYCLELTLPTLVYVFCVHAVWLPCSAPAAD
jgi:hypothetical protein